MAEVTLIKKLKMEFLKIFPPTGYDDYNHTYHGEDINEENNEKLFDFLTHPATLFFTFLGLSTRRLEAEEHPTFETLAKNFLGLQTEPANATDEEKRIFSERQQINTALIGPVATANLAITSLKLGWNILTIGTEVIWVLAATVCGHVAEFFEEQRKKTNNPLWYIPYGLTQGLSGLFHFIGFVGGAITSPIQNVRKGYRFGCALLGDNIAGKVLGSVLGALSIAITIAAVVVAAIYLFPLVAGGLGSIGPAIGIPFIQAAFSSAVSAVTVGLVSLGVTGIATSLATYLITAAATLFTLGVIAGAKKVTEKIGDLRHQQRMTELPTFVKVFVASNLLIPGLGPIATIAGNTVSVVGRFIWNGIKSVLSPKIDNSDLRVVDPKRPSNEVFKGSTAISTEWMREQNQEADPLPGLGFGSSRPNSPPFTPTIERIQRLNPPPPPTTTTPSSQTNNKKRRNTN